MSFNEEGVRTRLTSSKQLQHEVCLFVVDPQFEGNTSSELVPVAAGGQSVGVDLTLHVDVCVQRGIQELHGHQRLSVVHLRH